MPEEIRPMAVYSVAQVAELIHSDRRAVWAAMDDGTLRSFMPNGCKRGRRILGQWVLDWMEKVAARGEG
ncbi:MAG: hypothetical protein IJ092_05550 [Atopobiaceae bacterium]|nr:hypothetical protein [Atopobiaceae bacterium]